MIDDVLVDVMQRSKKMTREELVRALNLDGKAKHADRRLRVIKERINMNDGRFANTLIVGFSNGKGYKLADNPDEVKHFIREMSKRKESMDIQIEKAERMLKEMENL